MLEPSTTFKGRVTAANSGARELEANAGMSRKIASYLNQFVQSPTVAGLAISAGIAVDGGAIGQGLVAGANLVSGVAATGARIEDMIEKTEKGKLGGEDALAAVNPPFVGLEQFGVNTVLTDTLQMMQRLAAQGVSAFFAGRVKTAEERDCRKHISALIQIL